jgi:hypothetical protein
MRGIVPVQVARTVTHKGTGGHHKSHYTKVNKKEEQFDKDFATIIYLGVDRIRIAQQRMQQLVRIVLCLLLLARRSLG